MDFSQLCLKRESTRSYNDKTVSREDVTTIIKEASMGPSACNSQPWKMVVCDGEMAKLMPDLILGKDIGINHWTSRVSTFVIVCETYAKLMSGLNLPSQYFAQMDIGTIASSICYSAADKGIGSCVIGCFQEEKIKNTFSIPEDVKVRLIIALGYTDKDVRNKMRKDTDDILSFNKW